MADSLSSPSISDSAFAAARKIEDLLGEEGQRLASHLDRALVTALQEVDARSRILVLRRLGEETKGGEGMEEGESASPGEVEAAVREVIRRTRVHALKAASPRGVVASSGLRPSVPEAPLPRLTGPEMREPSPGVPLGKKDPSQAPWKNPPNLTTEEVVETVRRQGGGRRVGRVIFFVLLLLVGIKGASMWPARQASRLVESGISLSESALSASQIIPLRHPAFGHRPPQGNLLEAREALEAALARNPTDPRAHLALAWVDLAFEDRGGQSLADARRRLQEAEVYGASPQAVAMGQGMVAFRTAEQATQEGDREFSLQQGDGFFSKVKPGDSGYREAVWNRVVIALALGKKKEAQELADAFGRLFPGDSLGGELQGLVESPSQNGVRGTSPPPPKR